MRQGEGVRVAFLLVGEDLATGVERASGLETLISVNGGAFRPTAGNRRRSAGVVRGRLTAEETATPGPLIFRALADEAAVEWRDCMRWRLRRWWMGRRWRRQSRRRWRRRSLMR